MAQVVLLPSAERDLEDIHEYTVAEWSLDQAGRYFSSLAEAMDRVLDFPRMGTKAPEKPDIRIWNHRQHRIIYREAEYGIEVNRVLHHA